jgi:hypothetical protein
MNDRQLLRAVQKSLTPDLLVGRWQKQSGLEAVLRQLPGRRRARYALVVGTSRDRQEA